MWEPGCSDSGASIHEVPYRPTAPCLFSFRRPLCPAAGLLAHLCALPGCEMLGGGVVAANAWLFIPPFCIAWGLYRLLRYSLRAGARGLGWAVAPVGRAVVRKQLHVKALAAAFSAAAEAWRLLKGARQGQAGRCFLGWLISLRQA